MVIPGQLFVNNNTKEFGMSNSLCNGLLSTLTFKSAVIGLVVNSIKLQCLTLTQSLFSLNQLLVSESALFARTDSCYKSVSYRKTLVSSANISNLASFLTSTISLIYKMNSKGPRIKKRYLRYLTWFPRAEVFP